MSRRKLTSPGYSGVAAKSQTILFGEFEVHLGSRELHKHGIRRKLQDQPFRVLVSLLEKPGEVVTREELQKEIWGADIFVDFDKSLSAAVNKARQALDDSAAAPQFIETIPRIGYRYIGPTPSRTDASEIGEPTSHKRSWKTTRHLSTRVAAGVLLAALALTLWAKYGEKETIEQARPAVARSLTSLAGSEMHANFSPDGTQIAFIADTLNIHENLDIFVRPIDGGSHLRLTDDPLADMWPKWSPDGRSLAFVRVGYGRTDPTSEIATMPSVGGAEQSWGEIHAGFLFNQTWPPIEWATDGKSLVIHDHVDTAGTRPQHALFRLSLDTGERTRISDPPPGSRGDLGPALSPDGRTIAFVRAPEYGTADVWSIDVSPQLDPLGLARRLTYEERFFAGPVWTPSGKSLIVGGLLYEPGSGSLMNLAVDGSGKAVRIEVASQGDYQPIASPITKQLAFTRDYITWEIWEARVGSAEQPRSLISSQVSRLFAADYSPDGTTIAFISTRLGGQGVFLADRDGSNSRALYHHPDAHATWPRCHRTGNGSRFTMSRKGSCNSSW